MDKNEYAILILAAGSSERLGHPKQLVKWNQSTLLNHTIEQATRVGNADVFITLGANHSDIRPNIFFDLPIFINKEWNEGMGKTISFTISRINPKKYTGLILSVCDQPYITTDVFNNLISTFENGDSSIILSKYQVSSGPPTLFAKKHYPDLLNLSGDQGANKIVKKHSYELAYIDFPNGHIDIDTQQDFNNLTDFKSLH